MVDFRYHALSLVAVFLALGIGIVLGVTVGDSLVSDADRNLRDSLRDDVTEAREEVRTEQALGQRRDEVIEETAPAVAAGRLQGMRVGVLAFEELPGDVSEPIQDAVELGGGRVVRTAVVSWEERGRLAGVAGPPKRLGRLIVRGGPFARRTQRRLKRLFDGSFARPLDALVVYRHPPADPETDEDATALERRGFFEERVLAGVGDHVVGVERLDSDPSQVGWYQDRLVASVDDLDTAAGRLALVLVLARGAEGAFGYKDSAEQPIPDLSD